MMTNYNELVDHLVSTMKTNSPVQDVTNSPKDVHDFWYNSPDDWSDYVNLTTPNEGIKMNTTERKSFDELYNEYSAMSIPDQLTNLKELGRDFISKLDKIIDQLDIVLKDDSVGENDTKV